MKIRVTIETLDDEGSVDSVSSVTESVGSGVFDGDRALGQTLAIVLKGTLGQWSTNCPDSWVYESLFGSLDKGWTDRLAEMAHEWNDSDDDNGMSFSDYMESRLRLTLPSRELEHS